MRLAYKNNEELLCTGVIYVQNASVFLKEHYGDDAKTFNVFLKEH